jgi:hypothetical protein
MSALAIVALARHAFVTWSLSTPMALIMDAYNAVMQVLFGWAHPYLQAALTWLGSFIGWRPTLYPHWRDVFALVSLWTAGICRGLRRERRRWLFTAALGFVGGLLAALAAGLHSLEHNDGRAGVLIVMVPLLVIGLLLFGESVRDSILRGKWTRVVTGLMITLVVAGLGAILTPLWAYSGLVTLALLTAVLAVAMIYARPHRHISRFRPRAGWAILVGFIGAFCFFAIDAGLKLLMG